MPQPTLHSEAKDAAESPAPQGPIG